MEFFFLQNFCSCWCTSKWNALQFSLMSSDVVRLGLFHFYNMSSCFEIQRRAVQRRWLHWKQQKRKAFVKKEGINQKQGKFRLKLIHAQKMKQFPLKKFSSLKPDSVFFLYFFYAGSILASRHPARKIHTRVLAQKKKEERDASIFFAVRARETFYSSFSVLSPNSQWASQMFTTGAQSQ